ncbi:MAG: PhzF family phenazine biosynthesis protein [Acidobacteria bacterium]|nr:PhzF family phenazine biosynthesis protein [Acidobacteriota bacterium]MCB9399658.1 PhzF family phenazine biosynthesis protein [Acidobacteriota bacterium]
MSRHASMFQVDAFTDRRFSGNPAAVVVLERFPDEPLMQAIANENNLAETAFLVKEGNEYRIRWFTPVVEVPLCGHATLASAAVVLERLEPGRSQLVFHSASGPLPVHKTASGYSLNFPARPSAAIEAPRTLLDAIPAPVREVRINAFNYLAILETADQVRQLKPDMAALKKLDRPGVIVSAPGDRSYDFVSRYFAPLKGIPEDPVTGAAHCMLAPYWAERLGKTAFRAFQASARGGEVLCRLLGDRVELTGLCVFYMEGTIQF